MKKTALVALALVFSASTALAAPNPADAARSYKVTGRIVALTDTKIVLQKGKRRWEVARNAKTPVAAGVAVGSFATVEYTMTAVTIDPPAPGAMRNMRRGGR